MPCKELFKKSRDYPAIFSEKLSGTVEADETYVGGKNTGQGRKRKMENKTPVVSLVQRDGKARSRVVERVNSANLQGLIRDNVEASATVYTDDYHGYRGLRFTHKHAVVKHTAKEYARKEKDGVVHTNTVEGFFSLLKRGIIGSFHQVSKKHLPLYLAEFDFRYNSRKVSDGERTVAGLAKASGKRLTYRPLTAN